MAVHYKFNAAREFDTLPVDGLHISVADLKDAIIHHKRLGKGDVCDLQVTNAQTKEVYTDEKALIPKNSSLIIARVPIDSSKRRFGDVSRYDKDLLLLNPEYRMNTEGSEEAEYLSRKLEEIPDLTKFKGTEQEKIAAMMAQSTIDYHPSRYLKLRNTVMSGKVPPFYKCYKCHQSGHWVSDCPLNNQDLRKCSGIPSQFLREVDDANAPGVMITPQGKYVVFRQTSGMDSNADDKIPLIGKLEPPPELSCLICKEAMVDAVLTPCCAKAFCDECIRNYLLDSDEHRCYSCEQTEIGPDTLVPCRYLRIKILQFQRFGTSFISTKPAEDQIRSESRASSDLLVLSRPGSPDAGSNPDRLAPRCSPSVGNRTRHDSRHASPDGDGESPAVPSKRPTLSDIDSDEEEVDAASVSSKEKKRLKKKKKKEAKEAAKTKKQKKKDKEKKKEKKKRKKKNLPSSSDGKENDASPRSDSETRNTTDAEAEAKTGPSQDLMNDALGIRLFRRDPAPAAALPVHAVPTQYALPLRPPPFPPAMPGMMQSHPSYHQMANRHTRMPINDMRFPRNYPPQSHAVDDPLATFEMYLKKKDEMKMRRQKSGRSPSRSPYRSPKRSHGGRYGHGYSRSRSRSPGHAGSRRDSPRGSRRRFSPPSPSSSSSRHKFRSRSRSRSPHRPSEDRYSSREGHPRHLSSHYASSFHGIKNSSDEGKDRGLRGARGDHRSSLKESRGHGGYTSERMGYRSPSPSPRSSDDRHDLRNRIEEKRGRRTDETKRGGDSKSSRRDRDADKQRDSKRDSKGGRSSESKEARPTKEKDGNGPESGEESKQLAHRKHTQSTSETPPPAAKSNASAEERVPNGAKNGPKESPRPAQTGTELPGADGKEAETDKKKHDKKKKKKEKRRSSVGSAGEELAADEKKEKKRQKRLRKMEATSAESSKTQASERESRKVTAAGGVDSREAEPAPDDALKPFMPAPSKWEMDEDLNSSHEEADSAKADDSAPKDSSRVTSDVLKRAEKVLFGKAFPAVRNFAPKSGVDKLRAKAAESVKTGGVSATDSADHNRDTKRKGPSIQITISSKTESQIGKPKAVSTSKTPSNETSETVPTPDKTEAPNESATKTTGFITSNPPSDTSTLINDGANIIPPNVHEATSDPEKKRDSCERTADEALVCLSPGENSLLETSLDSKGESKPAPAVEAELEEGELVDEEEEGETNKRAESTAARETSKLSALHQSLALVDSRDDGDAAGATLFRRAPAPDPPVAAPSPGDAAAASSSTSSSTSTDEDEARLAKKRKKKLKKEKKAKKRKAAESESSGDDRAPKAHAKKKKKKEKKKKKKKLKDA